VISESTIWGRTCDGLVTVIDAVNLPYIKMGDWILFEDMGAQTILVALSKLKAQRKYLRLWKLIFILYYIML